MAGGRRDSHVDESGTVSRRVLLAGGVVGAAGALGSVTLGPKVVRRFRRASLGPTVAVPRQAVPVRSLTLDSAARGKKVGVRIIVPPALVGSGTVPVCVWLHGRGDRASTVVDELKVDHFLASAIAAGVPPFVVVAADGGEGYWHRRRDGDDAEAMVVEELPKVMASAGVAAGAWAIAGWSMGGFGSLLLAERHPMFVAVAASSPAVWFKAGDTRPGAFESAEDFAAHDVLGSLERLPAHVRIDCGTSDPFASTSAAMLRRIPQADGGLHVGAHAMRFWRSVLPAQLAFIGNALAR